jgi:regulator of sigma E protease
MSDKKTAASNIFKAIIFAVLAVLLVRFVVEKPSTSLTIFASIIGFGTCIIVHELGHFLIAKISGIKCHAFSIGFPPTLLGIKRTERGFRFRFLPGIFTKEVEGQEEPEARLSLTLYKPTKKPSDTEYCLGMIPFGGYVGMLGQEDSGVAEESNDPTSFANKPIGVRMSVIAAGVIFNLISAIVIFTAIAMMGMKQAPAVVGSVIAGSPAEQAGLVAGDVIVEIDGKKKPDFSELQLAPALAAKDAKIKMTVLRASGFHEEILVGTQLAPGTKLRQFGIVPAQTLTIASLEAEDAEIIYDEIGLKPADTITAVNGKEIDAVWELDEAVKNIAKPYVTLTAERIDPETQQVKTIKTDIALGLEYVASYPLESDADLTHIHSMIPRLKVATVMSNPISKKGAAQKLIAKFGPVLTKIGLGKLTQTQVELSPSLEKDDIIIKIGDVEYPSFHELRQVTAQYDNKAMPLTVLRLQGDGSRKQIEVEVTPQTPPGQTRPLIGINVTLDVESPIIAKTIDTGSDTKTLNIPRGAKITSIDGVKVSNFYDIINIINHNPGEHLSLEYSYQDNNELARGAVAMNVPMDISNITTSSYLARFIPFDDMKIIYKADNFFEAVSMGSRKMVSFVAQAYVTLKSLVLGRVSPDNLMGPLGIADISYRVIKAKEFAYYLNFLGMINCFLAVMNFLPIPIVDGGLFVMMIFEKLSGKAISPKFQQVTTYIGLAILGTLFLYVTFNDALRLILRLLVPE